MHGGMLWYNGNKHVTFIQKVEEAAVYYQKKYGRMPEVCLVNPGELKDVPVLPEGDVIEVSGRRVAVRTWKYLPTGHFLICFDGPPVVEAEPEPKPQKSDVVSAFEQHARKVTAST